MDTKQIMDGLYGLQSLNNYLLRDVLKEQRTSGKKVTSKLQYLILLGLQKPMAQGDLGKSLGADPMTMSQAVQQLKKAQLIKSTIHPDDARVKMLEITKKGKDQMNGITQNIRSKIKSLPNAEKLLGSVSQVHEKLISSEEVPVKTKKTKKAPAKKKETVASNASSNTSEAN